MNFVLSGHARTLAFCFVTYLLALLLVQSANACTAKYGEIVDFRVCTQVKLKDMTVAHLQRTQPGPVTALQCDNYEARAPNGDTASFHTCSTGVLGGAAMFELSGQRFTVLFDVPEGCARTRAGSWAPKTRGHKFFKGEPSPKSIRQIQDRADREEERCYKKDGRQD